MGTQNVRDESLVLQYSGNSISPKIMLHMTVRGYLKNAKPFVHCTLLNFGCDADIDIAFRNDLVFDWIMNDF